MESKMEPAFDDLVEFLKKDNEVNGYTDVPEPAKPTKDFLRDFKKAIRSIPKAFREPVNAQLEGIFFVNHLGSTAYTESVADPDGQARAGFTVFDVGALQRKANEWATWKESTAFGPGTHLRVTIERASNNTRSAAIEFILIHELSHVFALGRGLHPDWRTFAEPESYPFSGLSWVTSEAGGRQAYASRWDLDFQLRKGIKFYVDSPKKNPASAAFDTYRQLKKTDFATLYAATSPFDDFAESMTTYLHTVIEHRPYEVQVLDRKGGTRVRLRSCWTEKRCAQKRKFLEGLLHRP
jgi:hypothetical protein